MGSVRVGKYNYKTKEQPVTEGYTNVLIHTTGPLSPYTMRDKDGILMENYWQFSKVWSHVDAVRQSVSRFHPEQIRWEWPAEEHVIMENVDSSDQMVELLPAYWKWRKAGMYHHRWVRYPVGYDRHSEALGSVIGDPESDSVEVVDYIEARKRIYFPKYREIAEGTKMLRDLRDRLLAGENLQINEVDGPRYDESIPPLDTVVDGSIAIDSDNLRLLVNNPSQAFGHGYCLAAILLGIDVAVM